MFATLAYSRPGWSALWVDLHAAERDLALRINRLLLDDRSPYPALALPEAVAERYRLAYAAMDARRSR